MIVKSPGAVHTRVGRLGDDGTLVGQSELVLTAAIFDERPIEANQLIRPKDRHSGRRFANECSVRGREGRYFRVGRAGRLTTRVVAIDPSSGLSDGLSHVVPTQDIYDVRAAAFRERVVVSARGEAIIPAPIREIYGIVAGTLIEFICDGGDCFTVRPLSTQQ